MDGPDILLRLGLALYVFAIALGVALIIDGALGLGVFPNL